MTDHERRIDAQLVDLEIQARPLRAAIREHDGTDDHHTRYLADLLVELNIDVAEAFIGLEEQPGNRGYWHDRWARELKQALGIPYCMAAVDWWAGQTCEFAGIPDIWPVDTASTQTFYGYGVEQQLITKVPKRGSVPVWRDGKKWRGHVGLCLGYYYFDNMQEYQTIEANTSDPLSQWRDGRYVMKKVHTLSRVGEARQSGRWLRGFVDSHEAYYRTLKLHAADKRSRQTP